MKIKILYSHYNTNQDLCVKYRPFWFSYEKCFKNFLKTIEFIPKEFCEIEFHVIYDETRGKIEQNWIKNYSYINNKTNPIIDKKFNIINYHVIQGGSMFGAAKEMYRIAKELSEDMEDNDLFYFVENDYLHLPKWVSEIKNLFSTFNLNGGYVSTYDHGDKYTWMHLYENLTSKIFATSTRHFRTVPNTCGTYLCNKKLFLEDYDVHSGLEGDANKWAWLAENRGRFLLSPVPSLSTHCVDEELLAPTIDWKKISDQA